MNRYTYHSTSSSKISVKQLNKMKNKIQSFVQPNHQREISPQYPDNHIESQPSESFDNYYQQTNQPLFSINDNKQRKRKRKIFQRKIIKATVIPLQPNPKNNYNLNNQFCTNNQQQQQIYHNKHQQMKNSELQEHPIMEQYQQENTYNKWNKNLVFQSNPQTLKNKPISRKVNFQDQPIQMNQQKVYNADSRQSYHNQPNHLYSNNSKSQKQHQQTHTIKQHNEYPSKKLTNIDQQKQILDEQIIQNLNNIPQQLQQVRYKMLNQHEQLTMIQSKVQQYNKQNFRKQKQLLNILIQKQKQLTRRQQQLNSKLKHMNEIQLQNQKIQQKLFKSQLQLKKAKRIQQIAKQNSILYQSIIKNKQFQSIQQTIPKNSNTYMDYYYHNQQKQISILKGNKQEWENDVEDNTLRDLLSPLQINPDIDF